MSWLPEIASWYGVVLIASLAWSPWVRLLCASLPDRGASVAKPLGLLATVYPVWLLAFGPLPYSTAALWAVLVLAGVTGWAVVGVRRLLDRAWIDALVLYELVGLTVFLAALWLRGFTPEINTTEKPMDLALLAASQRADSMPPGDPWFAGETINYYYLGYLLYGSVARMADVTPAVAYNLALATTVSMTVTVAAGLGFNAIRRSMSTGRALVGATLAAFLLAFAGNLLAPLRLLAEPTWNLETDRWGWWNQAAGLGWSSSRVVCDGPRETDGGCPTDFLTINEFPFFSFLLGDLHPHVMALPFTTVALALALSLAWRERTPPGVAAGVASLDRSLWIRLIVSGAVVGSLYAFNSWDYPTFLLILLGAIWVGRRGHRLRARGVALGLAALASLIAWLPFYATFQAPVGSRTADVPDVLLDVPVVSRLLTTIAAHGGERTSASEFMTVWAVPWLAALWLFGTGFLRPIYPGDPRAPVFDAAALRPLVPGLAITALAALLLPAPVVLLAGVPLVLAVVQLAQDHRPSPRTAATGLYALGFALLIGTEFFYVQDLFGTRMNTIFKVYYQVWTLFAVATAVSIVVLWREIRPRAVARPAIAGFGALAILAGLVYPVVASYQWTDHFRIWRGLDGMGYLEGSAPDELAAIEWLLANAGAEDVILEAAGCSYQYVDGVPHNRASTFTGVPTVIGWGWHETQWRNGTTDAGEIGPRQRDVGEMYEEPTEQLLDRYGVTLLVVGYVEQRPTAGCAVSGPYAAVASSAVPGPTWEPAFSSGDVAIYRRVSVAANNGQAPQ